MYKRQKEKVKATADDDFRFDLGIPVKKSQLDGKKLSNQVEVHMEVYQKSTCQSVNIQ